MREDLHHLWNAYMEVRRRFEAVNAEYQAAIKARADADDRLHAAAEAVDLAHDEVAVALSKINERAREAIS